MRRKRDGPNRLQILTKRRRVARRHHKIHRKSKPERLDGGESQRRNSAASGQLRSFLWCSVSGATTFGFERRPRRSRSRSKRENSSNWVEVGIGTTISRDKRTCTLPRWDFDVP